MSNVAASEPDPMPGKRMVLPSAVSALIERVATKTQEYGTPLMTNNGRDALMDAFQEALDCVMYLAQAILEREDKHE